MRKTFILALALMACACGKETKECAAPRHNVYVVNAADTRSTASRTFAGVVEEESEVSVGFKTAGQISRICVREGQHVSHGELLAVLDDADYRLGVEALQIQYDQVSEEVARARKLYAKNSMTANDYEKAEAGLKQLGVQLQANKNKLAYTKLHSPVSGVVMSVNYSTGEMVDAGTAVFTLLDVSRKSVVADIPAAVYVRRDGISGITCRSAHDPQSECPMTLLSIVPKADGNQLYRMKLGFASGGAHLTPGMNVEVRLDLAADADAGLRIPQSALFRREGKDCVWVVRADSTIEMRHVGINPTGAGYGVDVISGLSADDRVVRAGVRMLHEGEKVNIIGEPSATNIGGVL